MLFHSLRPGAMKFDEIGSLRPIHPKFAFDPRLACVLQCKS